MSTNADRTPHRATWPERHRFGIDLTLAITAFAITTALSVAWTVDGDANTFWGTASDQSEVVWAHRPWAILVYCALIALPLGWRRVRPDLAAALTYAGGLLHLMVGVALLLPADFLIPVATYNVAAYGSRRASRFGAAGAVVGTIIVVGSLLPTSTNRASDAVIQFLLIGLAFTAAWAFGLVRRASIERLAALRERAKQLEVERDEQAQIATAAERARIAREMHDIVAHSLTVLVTQADGGRYAAKQDPDAAVRALTTIGEVGRAALGDMRRLLGVLRAADATDAATPGDVLRTPQPGIDALADLVAQVRAAGLRVSFGSTGTPRTLPPGSGLVVYRICQEALTNVLKHAGPDPSVSVMVMWHTTSLAVEIIDDGRGAAAIGDGMGQGIIGMRERAAVVHATIHVGPRPGGGYRVRLDLPLSTPGISPVPEEIS